MREIKFRGKTVDSNKWVCGDLVHNALTAFSRTAPIAIQESGCYPVEVHPETVGQYTGLCDKKDIEIYEGDIINHPVKSRPYSEHACHSKVILKVVWSNGKFKDGSTGNGEPEFTGEFINNDKHNSWGYDWSIFYDCEIIGNIYDNPELIIKDVQNA